MKGISWPRMAGSDVLGRSADLHCLIRVNVLIIFLWLTAVTASFAGFGAEKGIILFGNWSAHSAVVSRPPSCSNPLRIVSAPLFPCLHFQTHFHFNCLNPNFRLSYLLFPSNTFLTHRLSPNPVCFHATCYPKILKFVPSIQSTL